MAIRNIIFDLGGVIIDITPRLSIQAFASHIPDLDDRNVYQHPIFNDLETGIISSNEFRDRIRRELSSSISDVQIDESMIAMLGEIPADRIALLTRMKQHYRTFLLSNTNAIHYAAIIGYLLREYGAKSLDDYFHKTYYSHLVGMRKPDVRIFDLVLSESKLVPEETLYLDDSPEHLESARTLGIVTDQVSAQRDIRQILERY